MPVQHRRELARANRVVARTAALLHCASLAGSEWILENPADRGDSSMPHLFEERRHGPLWLMPEILALARKHSTQLCTFPMCSVGSDFQKYTTLMYTSGFASMLTPLNARRCDHPPGTHSPAGGSRDADGKWVSRESAAYPPDFNMLVADAVRHLVSSNELYLKGHKTSDPPNVPDDAGDDNVPDDFVAEHAEAVAAPASVRLPTEHEPNR